MGKVYGTPKSDFSYSKSKLNFLWMIDFGASYTWWCQMDEGHTVKLENLLTLFGFTTVIRPTVYLTVVGIQPIDSLKFVCTTHTISSSLAFSPLIRVRVCFIYACLPYSGWVVLSLLSFLSLSLLYVPYYFHWSIRRCNPVNLHFCFYHVKPPVFT